MVLILIIISTVPLCSSALLHNCDYSASQILRYLCCLNTHATSATNDANDSISTEFRHQIRKDVSNIVKSCAPSLKTYPCHIHKKEGVYTNMDKLPLVTLNLFHLISQELLKTCPFHSQLLCFSVKWLHQFRVRRGQGRFWHQNQHVLFQSSFCWRFCGAPRQSSGYVWKEQSENAFGASRDKYVQTSWIGLNVDMHRAIGMRWLFLLFNRRRDVNMHT